MRTRCALVLLLTAFVASCTSTTNSAVPSPLATPDPSSSAAPVGATLADGSALPNGCTGSAKTAQTVAFVADAVTWAMDPTNGRLSCLFEAVAPGPFAWGPQGDRVLLAGMQVQGSSPEAPAWPPTGVTPAVFDWGHPLGLAIVYASGSGRPRKLFMDDGRVERLSRLPAGTYQAIAYHPSGLALGFILDEGDRQGIWLSTNEGLDPQRLVFSRPDTVFSSLAFSPDGREIWWIAQHAGTISEIHSMDLADRTGFETVLTRGLAPTARGLLLAPAGSLMAATQGQGCADLRAMIVDADGARPAMPDATEPTEALGWLDASTLLVAAGGCDEGLQLLSVDASAGGGATVLVTGVDVGAPRTVLEDAPTQVPAPKPAEEEPPPGGVG